MKSESPVAQSVAAADRRTGWAVGGLLALAALAVYRGSFSVPLLLDDMVTIGNNASIRQLWPLSAVFFPSESVPTSGRPLLNLTFALNYSAGGTAVGGYHAVNLLIHVLAGATLFGLVRRTLLLPAWREKFSRSARWLALVSALVWTCHPLQTGAVTYLSQRAESLMGLCYLLTLYGFVRGATSSNPGRWLAGSVATCALGMASKEVMVTAPLLVWLYDRSFVAGTFRAAWAQRRGYYLGLAATWLVLAALMATSRLPERGVGFGQGFSSWMYALTEIRVVGQYLRLALWPQPLVFDYGADDPVPGVLAVAPCALLLGCTVLAAVVGVCRRSGWGFLGCAFFVVLAPTSSVVPVALQPMAESRMYLPLAAVVVLTVLAGHAWLGRWARPGAVIALLGCAVLAAARNADYRSELAIWSDTAAKRPLNSRAQNYLGMVLSNLPGRAGEAIERYERAVHIRPAFAEAHNNLANLLARVPGRLPDAIAEYEAALRARPDYAEVHTNLGQLLADVPGRLPEAVTHAEQAVRLRPASAEAHNNLGTVLAKIPARSHEALAHYEVALRLRPDYPEAHNNLGNALAGVPARLNEAVTHYEAALRLRPTSVAAHFNLGQVLLKLPGRRAEAAAHFEQVLQLRPDFAPARQALDQLRAASPP